MQGYKLEEMQTFWKSTGNCTDSYAENPVATSAWFARITQGTDRPQFGTKRRQHLMASFIYNALLERDRLFRPNATQVLEKLIEMDIVYPDEHGEHWVSECCSQDFYDLDQHGNTNRSPRVHLPFAQSWHANQIIPQWPIPDLNFLDKHLAYFFLGLDLEILAYRDHKNKTASLPGTSLHRICRSGSLKLLNELIPTLLEAQRTPTNKNTYSNSTTLATRDMLQNLYASSFFKTPSLIGCFEISPMRTSTEVFDPTRHVVQISLVRMCLERHKQAGTPYLVLMFDPTKILYGGNLIQPRINVWTSGLLPDTNWRRGVKENQRSFDRLLEMVSPIS